ncbi:MAG: M15 family metallopeptidase [Clostridiaceae bacterium]|nr:M15 family metallopeptidase [Clostridiaceae bacterium]
MKRRYGYLICGAAFCALSIWSAGLFAGSTGRQKSLSAQTKQNSQETGAASAASNTDLGNLRGQYDTAKAGKTVYTAGYTKKELKVLFYKTKITKKVFRRMKGKSYKKNCTVPKSQLRYLRMLYYGFDGKTHIGEMVVNRKIAKDVLEIFYRLYCKKYPIQKMKLVDEYNADDDRSMAANNTSCFNYRPVKGTSRLSKHSYGLAIDINPLYNPYVYTYNGKVVCEPKGSKKYSNRNKSFAYKISHSDVCYKLFSKYGFSWGGDWSTKKDYQHFER